MITAGTGQTTGFGATRNHRDQETNAVVYTEQVTMCTGFYHREAREMSDRRADSYHRP